MAKECKDFTFLGKSLSDLQTFWLSVDFDRETEKDLALSRSIEYTDTTSSRTEPSVKRAAFENRLSFEIHLVKNPDFYPSRDDRVITEAELREVTRWLTSTDTSQPLLFTYESGHEEDTCRYLGQFTDIQPFMAGGALCGLRLIFECSTCYGYTDDITASVHCQGSSVITVTNNSDDTNHYRYPRLDLQPAQTGQAYLANLSDCYVYDKGTLAEASDNAARMALLREKIENYGTAHGLSVQYQTDSLESDKIVTIENDTAIQFRFTGSSAAVYKCAAFYREDTRAYYIIRGGFLCLNVQKSLPVHMDSEHVTLFDDLGRMITYDSIGMADVDYFYWPRLLNGDNTLLFYARDCTFTLTHRELRKAGA